ncbi:MAG: LysM peptidoglycan-binding domain-containing protein, partial [Bacteroidales bacterium]|nr:LysM peptidoglycan-binding domain-containing protein [Bacteroidales bacterium]
NSGLNRLTLLFLLMTVYPMVFVRAQDTITAQDSIPYLLLSADMDSFTIDHSIVDPNTFTMEGELELKTGENLDSLLNLWYVNRSLEDAVDDYNPEADTLIPDFSDSVYLARLAEIPSVVDLTYNRIVKNYINVYTRKRREQVRIMLGLSEYYFPMFEEVFDYYGVPYELKYLSIIESALNPRAVSRVGAVGTWQFMYRTGRYYGLTINSLVDERRDPLAATHAAARFLVDLNKIYNDWTMALAAYNCGPGNVNKAIRRSGGKRNFWDIYYYLPRETRGYVPAFIAATYAMNYYPDHLLTSAPLQLPRYTDTMEIHEPLHLKQIAEVLGIPVQQLRDINPQFRQDVIPATSKQAYAVRIPVEQVASFIDLKDSIFAYKDSVFFDKGKLVASPQRYSSGSRVDLPADKYDKLYYTVRSGDNVGYIADWYDVRASDLRYWNNISRNLIRSGQKLVIYKSKGSSARYREISNMSFADKQRFAGRASGSSNTTSGPSNSGNQAPVVANQVPLSQVPAATDTGEYITYTVQQGDSLWEIARKYPGTTETDIARLNNITNSSKIRPGQVLRIKTKL